MPSIPRTARGKDIIVEEVVENASFKCLQYDLNPRLDTSFPSASLSAQRYDMYEFEELEFRFHPTRAVTNTAGVVFLGWEPNANRGPPSDIKELNAYEYHTEGPAYSPNIVLRVNKTHLPPPRYCRATPTSSDLNLYDTGTLIVGVDAFATSAIKIGYVEVYYKIKFYNYHLADTLPKQNRLSTITLATTALSAGSPGSPVSTEIPTTVDEDFGSSWISKVGNGIVLPLGKYLLTLAMTMYDTGAASQLKTQLLKDGVAAATGHSTSGGANNFVTNTITKMIESTGSEVWTFAGITEAAATNAVATQAQIQVL